MKAAEGVASAVPASCVAPVIAIQRDRAGLVTGAERRGGPGYNDDDRGGSNRRPPLLSAAAIRAPRE